MLKPSPEIQKLAGFSLLFCKKVGKQYMQIRSGILHQTCCETLKKKTVLKSVSVNILQDVEKFILSACGTYIVGAGLERISVQEKAFTSGLL